MTIVHIILDTDDSEYLQVRVSAGTAKNKVFAVPISHLDKKDQRTGEEERDSLRMKKCAWTGL